MRLYLTLDQALSEIKRDVYKSPLMQVTRVQQQTGKEFKAREAIGYSYSIAPLGIPFTAEDLVLLGLQHKFKVFESEDIVDWLNVELTARLHTYTADKKNHIEKWHPALSKTFEGNHLSYTYPERMQNATTQIITTLTTDRDTRRAYWPIYQPIDAYRSDAPTRIPCSLGYQFMIRKLADGEERLIMIYMQRSSDFDTFFLSDVWFASRFQEYIAHSIKVRTGPFIHMINSLHSFNVDSQEIY